MKKNQTDTLISDLYDLGSISFPDGIIHQVKRCLLDYLGVTFSGAALLGDRGKTLLNSLNERNEGVSVIGFKCKTDLVNAALFNGVSSHQVELDDGTRFGMIHPGAPIFSALLPVAEKEKVSAEKFILGAISGYEAAIRLAGAVQPGHYAQGYHPSGTCGAIGAAAGIAAMLNFSKKELKGAISSASVSAGGMLKVIEDGTELKPFNIGRAASSSVIATYTAKSGFEGLSDVLGGDIGFLKMMSSNSKFTYLNKSRNESYEIEKLYFKLYASCRHTHPSIEGALKIKKEQNLRPENIKKIAVYTYETVIGKHDHTDIEGVTSAKMSIPFSLALALFTDAAGIKEFSKENVENRNILALTKKVTVFGDKEISALVPNKRSAIVVIETNNGLTFRERVDYPKGEPENPLTDKEIVAKFKTLLEFGGKTESEIEKLIEVVWDLENRLPELFELL